MKKPGLGIQKLSELINNGYVYVDKTEHIHSLIDSGKYYFLSRPRRFGKSLLVDTIGEIFRGRRELFEDCWIYDKWDWEDQYPVIKISFTEMSYKAEGLEKALDVYMDELAEKHGVNCRSANYSGKFTELIRKVGEEKQVVVLIDEYDKPIIDYLEKEQLRLADENREILKSFYQGVKDADGRIKFFFITGVSKFSKVSIFSDLNHLRDISVTGSFAGMLGYTEEEIRKNYDPYLKKLYKEYEASENEMMEMIRDWYDGYSWDGKVFVYNPFSLLNLFLSNEFKNYWFETGTPTFLLEMLKDRDEDLTSALNVKVKESAFSKYDIEKINVISLMFQAGYLTVKSHDRRNRKYVLDFPNREVRESFLEFALENFADKPLREIETINDMLIDSLRTNDLESFFLHFRALFSSIAVKQLDKVRKYEGFYHSIVFVVLRLLGVQIQCELQSSFGATDAVIQMKDYIYVFEFKNGTAAAALEQIKKRRYCDPFLNDPRTLLAVGASLDTEARNIGEYLVEAIQG